MGSGRALRELKNSARRSARHGGFISFPGGMMAVLKNFPLVVHEQNSVAGTWPTECLQRLPTGFSPVRRTSILNGCGAAIRACRNRRAPRRSRAVSPRIAQSAARLGLVVVGGSPTQAGSTSGSAEGAWL